MASAMTLALTLGTWGVGGGGPPVTAASVTDHAARPQPMVASSRAVPVAPAPTMSVPRVTIDDRRSVPVPTRVTVPRRAVVWTAPRPDDPTHGVISVSAPTPDDDSPLPCLSLHAGSMACVPRSGAAGRRRSASTVW